MLVGFLVFWAWAASLTLRAWNLDKDYDRLLLLAWFGGPLLLIAVLVKTLKLRSFGRGFALGVIVAMLGSTVWGLIQAFVSGRK